MDLETMIALMAAALYREDNTEENSMAEAVRKAKRLWLEVCTNKGKV